MKNKYKVVCDAHNDTMMKIIDPVTWKPVINIGEHTDLNIDIPKLIQGGVNIVYFAAYTTDQGYTEVNNSYLLALMNALNYTLLANPEKIQKGLNYSQIDKTISDGKIVAIQTIEGAYSISAVNATALLKQYSDCGVKAIALVWNLSNALGEGTLRCYFDESPSTGGLTLLGEQVITQMNKLGIIVDVSHMDESTFWGVVKVSKAPIIASHSGVYAVNPHVRNLKDEQIKAIAASHGVVNIVFCRYFIGDEYSGVEKLVDHIDYVVKLVGVDYVGLGSDFDGATMPVGLPDVSHMQEIANVLQSRGYFDEEIEKILGLNNLRVLKQVEKQSESEIHKSKVYDLMNDIEIETVDGEKCIFITLSDEEFGACLNTTKFWLDGISFDVQIDYERKRILFILNSPLIEIFHIASFEIVSSNGMLLRKTRILELI